MKNICSVIVVTYNREKLILDALNSVFNQTYRPIELIIVNDGSTDQSAKMIKNWIGTHQDELFNIIYREQKNLGAPLARNLGLDLCKGEFIQFLDSDDLLEKSKLEVQISALESNPDILAAWNPRFWFNDFEEIEIHQGNDINEPFIIKDFQKNPMQFQFLPTSGLFRKRLLEKVGHWDADLKRWQDFEYHIRISLELEQIISFNNQLYFFRQHSFGRINDQYRTINGLTNGYLTLKRVEQKIEKNLILKNKINQDMFYLYFSLFQLSILNQVDSYQNKIIPKLIYWSPNKLKKIKSLTLMLIVKLRLVWAFKRWIFPK